MSKLTRITQKIFGASAGLDQIAQFGSLFAGSPAFTTDPAVAMSLSNWLEGWFSAVIGGNSPAIEDMNAVLFVYAYQLAYIMQAGTPEWDTGTTYYIGSFVNVSGVAYVSRTDANAGNDPTSDTTNWKKIGGDIMSALGDMLYGGANGLVTRLAGNTSATPAILTQTGDGLGSSAAPAWRAFKPPSVQRFLSTGSTAGWLFTISTSSTVAVGDTYTNNGHTYTVLNALTAQTGQVLFCSGASAPTSSGTLTRATGSGTSSITFTASVALGAYTVPSGPAPLYLKVSAAGAGGGGSSSGHNTLGGGAGSAGTVTAFGSNVILCGGGGGGTLTAANTSQGGVGGTATVNAGATVIRSISGGKGQGNGFNGSATSIALTGGVGGTNPLGGADLGNDGTSGGAVANSGAGGAGGGTNGGIALGQTGGSGGGAGAYVEAIIANPVAGATYYYCVGTGGTGGSNSGDNSGSAGGDGVIEVTEYYQ